MSTLNLIYKTKEYLNYIEQHVQNINKAWKLVQDKCHDMRFIQDDCVFWSIDCEVEEHDLSKLSKEEFTEYRDHFYPMENPMPLDLAWKHHKANNPHHWENWERNRTNPYNWEINCVHMVIDWVAMSFTFNDTAEAYYEKNKRRIKLIDCEIKLICEIFDRLYKENHKTLGGDR